MQSSHNRPIREESETVPDKDVVTMEPWRLSTHTLTKKQLIKRAGQIAGKLEGLSEADQKVILEMVGVVFPKFKGMQRLKETSDEDRKIIQGDIENVSGGLKSTGY